VSPVVLLLNCVSCSHISTLNWFLMMPSIATKFQYVNSFLFSFSLTTCFGPYGPSSGEIYNWMLQWTISNTTDLLHVCDPMQRCYMLHIGAPTLHSQYMLSHEYKYKSCRHKIVKKSKFSVESDPVCKNVKMLNVKIYPRGGFWAVLQFLWPASLSAISVVVIRAVSSSSSTLILSFHLCLGQGEGY
jgi:hypothetical protein